MNMKIVFILFLVISFNIYQVNATEVEELPKKNVIFLGASNTVEEINSVSRNGSFITVLRTLNSDWENVNLIDKAISGWMVSNYYGEIDLVNETVFDNNPNYIVIVLGGNDFLRRTSPDGFKIRYNWLLDSIIFLKANSLIDEIFIANIFWGTLDLDDALISDFQQYQEIIANASIEYSFPLLNFFEVTENHPEYYVDSIHLNDLGQEAISVEVNRIVQPYLNGSISRSEDFLDVIDLYSNSYVSNNPSFMLIMTSVSLATIILYYKSKKKNF